MYLGEPEQVNTEREEMAESTSEGKRSMKASLSYDVGKHGRSETTLRLKHPLMTAN